MPDSGQPATPSAPRPPLIDLLPGARRLMQRVTHSHEIESQLLDLIAHDPVIERINLRLAAYLPAAITQTYCRELLLASCVKAGIAAAPPGCDDRTHHYLAAVVETATLVLRYNLVSPDGRWNPLYDPPLMVWMQLHKGKISSAATAPWAPIPLDSFKQGLRERLMCQTESRARADQQGSRS